MANGRASRKAVRAPAIVHIIVLVSLVVLLGVFALSSRQPPPPTIAEFAPQATETIREAPEDQTSSSGLDSVPGGPGAQPSPTPDVSDPSFIEVPRVRRCVGDPPRQTEDPQSPPCVPYWSGDNGGETARGVNGDEIKVALPIVFLEDEQAINDLVKHFNRRFEMYGRKIVVQTFTPAGNLAAHPNPSQEQADAAKVEEMGSFASLSTGLRWGSEHHYYDELARRKILSVAHGVGSQMTEDRYREFAPYQWGTLPGTDMMLRNYAEFVCNGLAGNPPRFASGEESLAPTREFGLIYQRTTDNVAPDVTPLEDGLARCGVRLKEKLEDRPSGDTGRNAQGLMLRMKNSDVTSVICLCFCSDVRDHMMPAASAQGYFPEWLLSTYVNNDVENCHRSSPPDQVRGVIGVSYTNKQNLREDMPWYWALKEVDSNYNPSEGAYYHLSARYSSLLLLASGIQNAGPNLTAETFQQGLFKTKFDNPGAGAAPYFQARVGFEGRKHTFMSDGAMFWYDQAEKGYAEPSNPGTVCYVDRGLRYGLGRWPESEPAFREPPCR